MLAADVREEAMCVYGNTLLTCADSLGQHRS
jgi:hypothetical protein